MGLYQSADPARFYNGEAVYSTGIGSRLFDLVVTQRDGLPYSFLREAQLCICADPYCLTDEMTCSFIDLSVSESRCIPMFVNREEVMFIRYRISEWRRLTYGTCSRQYSDPECTIPLDSSMACKILLPQAASYHSRIFWDRPLGVLDASSCDSAPPKICHVPYISFFPSAPPVACYLDTSGTFIYSSGQISEMKLNGTNIPVLNFAVNSISNLFRYSPTRLPIAVEPFLEKAELVANYTNRRSLVRSWGSRAVVDYFPNMAQAYYANFIQYYQTEELIDNLWQADFMLGGLDWGKYYKTDASDRLIFLVYNSEMMMSSSSKFPKQVEDLSPYFSATATTYNNDNTREAISGPKYVARAVHEERYTATRGQFACRIPLYLSEQQGVIPAGNIGGLECGWRDVNVWEG